MTPAPTRSKSTLLLLGLLYLQACIVDATISTSAGFPRDVFAQPAFQVQLGSVNTKDAPLPVKRSHASAILEQHQHQASSSSSESTSSLAVAGQAGENFHDPSRNAPHVLQWSLQRSSPTDLHLCSIPDFTSSSAKEQRTADAGPSRSRQDLLRNAQNLLEPLKKVCLYHTFDWFTYSFCYGREVRQFRRLGAQTAAQKAFKAAGGGTNGEKAAQEAAKKVSSLQHPIADPEYPAFILGRWTPQNEDIVGDDQSHQRHSQQPLSDLSKPAPAASNAVSSDRRWQSYASAAGLDLVEEVQFGDWDEDELYAAEAKALAQLAGSQSHAVESSGHASSAGAHDSQRHRFLTQRWTNGTMCDMNHQPRSIEVQFHCSNRKPLEDRIVMFKETTICNYVLVIETPRLCADPAFGSEKQEAPLPVQCHKTVEDTYQGPTLGEPDKVLQPPLSQLQAAKDAKQQAQAAQDSHATSVKDADAAQETASTHTYGDISRFSSVYDDYYDEALGGHGALFHQYHDHEHDHDHEHEHGHGHEHDDELLSFGDPESDEIMVEVGIDEDGKLVVNEIDDVASADPSPPREGKESRRRESGKKRSDDDGALEIELDMDDFLSVLRGDQGGSLERKLAEKISQVLNREQQKQSSGDAGDAGEPRDDAKKQTPEEVAKLYNRLMAAVTGGGHAGKDAADKPAKGAKHKQPPTLRMEKVGDSLSERAKRFYDAKARESEGEGDKRDTKTIAPNIAEHLEL